MRNLLFFFVLASAFIPARISGLCASSFACSSGLLKFHTSLQFQTRLRASETDGCSLSPDSAAKLSPTKLKEPVPLSDISKFPRRAIMFSAAFGQLSPFFGSESASAIDMQNAAGVGINNQPSSGKKPAPGSKAAQLAIFQVCGRTYPLRVRPIAN